MNFIKKYISTLNKHVYKNNKEFAAKFRDTAYHHNIYDRNLFNLMHTMFLIKSNFDRIVFIGPNPDTFLKKLPSSI